jgi:hypothetical protein
MDAEAETQSNQWFHAANNPERSIDERMKPPE